MGGLLGAPLGFLHTFYYQTLSECRLEGESPDGRAYAELAARSATGDAMFRAGMAALRTRGENALADRLERELNEGKDDE